MPRSISTKQSKFTNTRSISTKQPKLPLPRLASRVDGITPSLYARVLKKYIAIASKGEVYPFHIGETYLLPSEEINAALRAVTIPDIHHYGAPQGLPELRTRLAAMLRGETPHSLPGGFIPTATADQIIITSGATHGLSLACQALLDPGDVMMLCTPHWPLINAMVHTASAVSLEVPFTSELRKHGDVSPYELLCRHYHPRCKALYVTSPNNPDGVVLSDKELAQVAAFCVDHNIYAIVDEAYDRFHFGQGPRPRSLSTFPGMKERTVNVFTFSKSHRMAGLRVGYTVAPTRIIETMVKLANISVYNVAILTQQAALAALSDTGEEAVKGTVDSAMAQSKILCQALEAVPRVKFKCPEGGAYVFADLSDVLQGRDCFDLLDDAIDQGVIFAPGLGFGQAFRNYGRFCFTAMDKDKLERGCERLVEVLSKPPPSGHRRW